MVTARHSSYAPKNTNPPSDIHNTLGPTPLNNAIDPSSATVLLATSIAPLYGTPCPSTPIIISGAMDVARRTV
eukprot:CAMPEP_0203637562 /NCGR_PEP_ID=MMETSP0088-20131115/3853_1 /ASSEMBLY_ACC=CAM_ASM_001087 /TAXON_ID=426623 /ORGANISM="Chaetoceros affinis, Strain CCMP159" /LENGTH=72 /DNA_ID=CAMNT_0050492025 /DNA_START=94 /DNA_END=309 /DNA_ORIENTATION=-